MAFGFDHFDLKQWRPLNWFFTDKTISPKSAIIWDEFYSRGYNVSLDRLLMDEQLHLLQIFEERNWDGNKNKVAVFVYNGTEKIKWKISETIYFNDFENEKAESIDSSHSFSGRKCARVDERNAFSPGLSVKANQLSFSLPAVLQFSGDFFAPDINYSISEHPLLVVSLVHDGTAYFWKGIDITNFMNKEKKWTAVSFHLEVPAVNDTSDVLQVYVWNNHATPVYVDNLKIERIERE